LLNPLKRRESQQNQRQHRSDISSLTVDKLNGGDVIFGHDRTRPSDSLKELLTSGKLLYTMYYNNIKRCFMTTAISVRLPKELADQLDSIARETERPRSYIIQKALESYIDDYADLQIALDRLHDKTAPVVSGKELRKSLGL